MGGKEGRDLRMYRREREMAGETRVACLANLLCCSTKLVFEDADTQCCSITFFLSGAVVRWLNMQNMEGLVDAWEIEVVGELGVKVLPRR